MASSLLFLDLLLAGSCVGGGRTFSSLRCSVTFRQARAQGSSVAGHAGDGGCGAQAAGTVSSNYAGSGRPSIAPEKLLRALLLQVLYTVRSERLLMEQLDYNFLFRWFVGLSIDEPVWDATVSAKTASGCWRARSRRAFLLRVARPPSYLLSGEHFTVDGTLIEAWAGQEFQAQG